MLFWSIFMIVWTIAAFIVGIVIGKMIAFDGVERELDNMESEQNIRYQLWADGLHSWQDCSHCDIGMALHSRARISQDGGKTWSEFVT